MAEALRDDYFLVHETVIPVFVGKPLKSNRLS
jgi:hypothetical protein